MKTKINKFENDWVDIKNKCRTTVNKDHTDILPKEDFKLKLLISEHSPIRLLKVNWLWDKIKYWISQHYVRHHIGIEKWVSTQRSDRINKNRDELSQSSLVKFEAEANAHSLINISRVRLCNEAHKETRILFEDLKFNIKNCEPELFFVLVPNCIYRCGCPEFKSCGFWDFFKNKYKNNDLLTIKSRYELYNNEFLNNQIKMEE